MAMSWDRRKTVLGNRRVVTCFAVAAVLAASGARTALALQDADARASAATPVPHAAAESTPGEWTLERRLARIKRVLDQKRQEQHIPGLSYAIVKDDTVIAAEGLGVRDVEKGLPAEPQTIYSIGSQTKAFTALLCAMMVDEGKMSFDAPVTAYLAWFALKTPELTQQVTIRDALSHRVGLQRTDLVWASGKASRRAAIEQIRFAEAFAPLRSTFLYNNVMFMAAGEAAASAGGYAAWEPMVRERIFTPLGMTSTFATTAEAKADPRMALGYSWVADQRRYKNLPVRNMDTCGPAGSIYSNVMDMSLWVRAMLRRGEYDAGALLKDKALFEKQLWAPQNAMQPGAAYGMGWMMAPWKTHQMVFHGGNIDGYACMVAMIPEEDLGFVLLHNTTFSALQDASRDIVFASLLDDAAALDAVDAPGPAAIPEDQLRKYEGFYEWGEEPITCLIKDGKLALDVPGQMVYTLAWPDADGLWAFELTDTIKIRFHAGEDGSIVSLTQYQNGQEYHRPRQASRTARTPAIDAGELQAMIRGRVQGPAPATARITGSMNFIHQGVTAKVTMLSKGPKFVVALDMGDFGFIRTGYDGARAWTDSDVQNSEIATGRQAAALRLQDPALLWGGGPPDLFAEFLPLATEDVRGRRAYRTELISADGVKTTVWFDAEKGRPMKEKQELPSDIPGAGNIEISYTRWQRHGPVEFPMKMTMEPPGLGKAEMNIDRVELDVSIDDSEFSAPAGVK